MRGDVRSWRQLPLNLYQIQTKFRDELRPRAGLMRGREFIMKDAYSFHVDEKDAEREYENMYDAYKRIFTRCGLAFRAVEADTGNIGGSLSHEFQVLAETGEDALVACDTLRLRRQRRAGGGAQVRPRRRRKATQPMKTRRDARAAHDRRGVGLPEACRPTSLVKTLIYLADGKPVAVLVRGDREVNEIKVKKRDRAPTDVVLADRRRRPRGHGRARGLRRPRGPQDPRLLRRRGLRDDRLRRRRERRRRAPRGRQRRARLHAHGLRRLPPGRARRRLPALRRAATSRATGASRSATSSSSARSTRSPWA